MMGGTDTYQGPAGAQLTFRFDAVEHGRHIRSYATPACGGCARKPQCTRRKGGRRITRWVDEHLLEAMEQRVRRRPEVMKQRKPLVEHPCGTMKRWWDAGYVLMRGREGADGVQLDRAGLQPPAGGEPYRNAAAAGCPRLR